jgi:hypothetical protein
MTNYKGVIVTMSGECPACSKCGSGALIIHQIGEHQKLTEDGKLLTVVKCYVTCSKCQKHWNCEC